MEQRLDQPAVRTRSHMSVRELARRLGVSSATVSRALNNHPEVSDETRARVLAMADETGYHFRVGKRFTNVIGLVYPTDPVAPDDGSFENALLAGVLSGVNEQRFDVQVINVERDKSHEETYTQFFRRKGLRSQSKAKVFATLWLRVWFGSGFHRPYSAGHWLNCRACGEPGCPVRSCHRPPDRGRED